MRAYTHRGRTAFARGRYSGERRRRERRVCAVARACAHYCPARVRACTRVRCAAECHTDTTRAVVCNDSGRAPPPARRCIVLPERVWCVYNIVRCRREPLSVVPPLAVRCPLSVAAAVAVADIVQIAFDVPRARKYSFAIWF